MIRITMLDIIINLTLFAQLSAPRVENVYGGRINDIKGYQLSSTSTRLFISTESANSVFYTDVTNLPVSAIFSNFTVMPGLGADDNYGSGIQQIAPHAGSGYLFAAHNSGLLEASTTSSSVTIVVPGAVNAVFTKGDYLFYIMSGKLYYGTVNALGVFTSGGAGITLPAIQQPQIIVNPANNRLYVFGEGTAPLILKSSSIYSAVNAATTFTDISPTTLSATYKWVSFGIGPDGRIFTGRSSGVAKTLAYTDDEITWTEYATGISGVPGKNIAYSGTAASYYIYWAKSYNTNNGNAGAWLDFGQVGGLETHPNDGNVFVDPVNSDVVYMTTDQGIGASRNRGEKIFEIDGGVEAVQVEDFDMSTDKNTAYLASKSGVRKVTSYLTSPIWSKAMFPNNDGSPYFSVDMSPTNSAVAYAGNVRVYKTVDSGATWSRVFTAESAPYNYSGINCRVEAIEICKYNENIVFAGYYIDDVDEGGIFYSHDAGATWNQLLLESATVGKDVDVYDIAFNLEGTDTVAYIGVSYDISSPQGRSVYRLVKNGATWTAAQDMNAGGTSTGSLIVATIRDLYVSTTGDTVYASGTDASINHPIVYYKPIKTTNKWTPVTISGFPFVTGKQGYAVTLGVDTLYTAVDNEIYYLPLGAAAWKLGYTYPTGTRINFLYYDELLAGTGTGLYGHTGKTPSGVSGETSARVSSMMLEQNYPNPFNPSTRIEYSIPNAAKITLSIYAITGELLATPVDEYQQAGVHTAVFNADGLPSGMYIYKLSSGTMVQSKKLILLK